MKYLLVCEGPTDLPILREVAERYGHEVEMLRPAYDRTSQSHKPHGWDRVRRWCRRHHAKIHVFLREREAEVLMLHMDTDIAGEIDRNYRDKGLSRRECCEAALNAALQSDRMPDSCYYVLPTMATETWLLALYDSRTHPTVFTSQMDNYETYPEPKMLLRQIGWEKSVDAYESYAAQLLENTATVRARCAEFDALCRRFEGERCEE